MSASPHGQSVTLPRSWGAEDDRRLVARVLAPLDGASSTWWLLLVLAAAGTALFLFAMAYTVAAGIGVWGNNVPVAWAFPITSFVWWIGLGHAGTFLSAFLLLMEQRWRAAVSRLAETMTIFAVAIAGVFPVLHLGRPWFLYWLVPYPSTMGVWPNFKSSLPWDVAAVATYLMVSLMFWYLGMLPDLATAREHVRSDRQRIAYGVLALGWVGSRLEWRRRAWALSILAAIAAALVVSVHTVVSLDFTIAQLPGWHSTIFPPYFVVGALYSGAAMVLVLTVVVRNAYRVGDVITDMHYDRLARLTLALGLLLLWCDVLETFSAWYSGDVFERAHLQHRMHGAIGAVYWTMLALNVLPVQLLWFRGLRRRGAVLVGVGIAILIGMWLERFVIIVGSLARDFLPSSWGDFVPTWVDLAILFGSIGFFLLLYLLFLRFLPFAALSDLRAQRLIPQEHGKR